MLMWTNLHIILEFTSLLLDKCHLALQWHFNIALLFGYQIHIQFCKRDFNNSKLKAIILLGGFVLLYFLVIFVMLKPSVFPQKIKEVPPPRNPGIFEINFSGKLRHVFFCFHTDILFFFLE